MRLKAERKFIDDNAHWLKLESPLAVCFLQNDEAMLAFSSKVLACPAHFSIPAPYCSPTATVESAVRRSSALTVLS